MNIDEFKEECKKLGISLTPNQMNSLEKYYKLLIEKNKVVNLTRIIEHNDVYLKHFYDSLTLSKVVDLNNNLTLCDVGTGAGFPGIVIKIVFPNLNITLIDSLQKRVKFLNEVIETLDLKNIKAIHTRSEDYAKNNNEKFDIVTSRAVANLNKLLMITIPLLKKDGTFIAMKANVNEEIEESMKTMNQLKCNIIKKDTFFLYNNDNLRNLLVIKKY